MSDTVSACCRAEIRAYIPHGSFYRTSPRDPVPYCTACGAEGPEEVEPEEEEENEQPAKRNRTQDQGQALDELEPADL